MFLSRLVFYLVKSVELFSVYLFIASSIYSSGSCLAVCTQVTHFTLCLLPGKAESLKDLQDEILKKSTQLDGLDTKLKELLDDLRKKANDLRTCQG